tara:strand:+ start:102 stop:1232 length:1131 start_codon:yes stop_codon:yes gene_type:complete
MGAGSCQDHYIQDAAEYYWAYICQKELEENGKNITSVEERLTEFNDYCSERDITDCFDISDYKINMDKCVKQFINNLIKLYPDKQMDITNVESEYRNKSKKGDFLISFNDGEEISFSLKNYQNGYDIIQLKSGTWHSIINNFALDPADGPGMYIDHAGGGRKFRAQGKSLKKRNDNYEKLGLGEIVKILEELDSILLKIKDKYILSEDTKIFNDKVSLMWQEDCKLLGHTGIELVIKALDLLPKDTIKTKLLKDTDLINEEELLLIGPNGEMMCSLYNEKYKNLLLRVNNGCDIDYKIHEKNLRFYLNDREGEILNIDIPFTLQKNGAWFIPKNKYEGTLFHKKENKYLMYGERRPKKSREINTSTNIWFCIKNHL